MTLQSFVGAVPEGFMMDMELMPAGRARRVNGYLKRSDRRLSNEKLAIDADLKKRLARLDADMAKVRDRADELQREKNSRCRQLHIRRRSSDVVDGDRLPLVLNTGGLLQQQCDLAASAPDVRLSRSMDGTPPSSLPSSRRSSLIPGLRETLLKSSINRGNNATTARTRGHMHNRSSSLPNIGNSKSPISSPSGSPLLERRSRRQAFMTGSSRGSSRDSSKDSSLAGSRGRNDFPADLVSSRESSLDRSRHMSGPPSGVSSVYCSVSRLFADSREDLYKDEDGHVIEALIPFWEVEDEVDKHRDRPEQPKQTQGKATKPTKKEPNENSWSSADIVLTAAARKLALNETTSQNTEQPAAKEKGTSAVKQVAEGVSTGTIATGGTASGPRSFRALKEHSLNENGYRREETEQAFMEDTQTPESLEEMFKKLKSCRYLRCPGESINPLGDVDDIFN